MPVSTTPKDMTVSLLAVEEASAAVIYGLHEVFTCVGNSWQELTGIESLCRQIKPRIVGQTTNPIRTTMGATLVPDHTIKEVHLSDIIIVGDLNLPRGVEPTGHWGAEIAWLKNQYERGAVICSVCTGSLILAEAGLLDNREATTHWSASATFEQFYPQVLLKPERILVPTGEEHRIVTSGGSASWNDLVLYLIARFCGNEEARHITKIFLIGDRQDGQLPFAAMARPKQHDDGVISQCQQWIADHYTVSNPVAKMTEKSGLSPRTFKRRFRYSTGYAPLDYVQTLRIEEAKQMLETTSDAIDDIAFAVGYEEANSFRRLFKRTTGINPHQYRLRFQNIAKLPVG